MRRDYLQYWLAMRPQCRALLVQLVHPMTVTHIAHVLGLERDVASYLVRSMCRERLLKCRNPGARRHRVYGLTRWGRHFQDRFRKAQHLHPWRGARECDWSLFGAVCFRHRAAVLLALDGSLRRAQIRRRATGGDADVRMSANNVGDVLRFFLKVGIAERCLMQGDVYPHYRLTPKGKRLREMLLSARSQRRA